MNEELQQLTRTVLNKLTGIVEDFSTLEVSTYVCTDADNAGPYNKDTRTFPGAKLAAFTRIELDGDQVNLLPEQANGELQTFHAAAVLQAQQNRKAFLDTVVGLLDLGGRSGASAKK